MSTHSNNDPMRFGILYQDDPKEWKRRYAAQYRRDNPIKHLLQMAKSRCKHSGLEFNIEVEDLEVPEFCPIFPEIKLESPDGDRKTNGYSLDRIDNSKGYIKGNVRVISMLANLKKDNWTIESVERLLAYMKGEI